MNKKQARKQLRKLVDLKSLPKNKARVEIAKDVIAALEVGALYPEQMAYVLLLEGVETGDMRTLLGNGVRCNTCALGACFTAIVARNNDFDVMWLSHPGLCLYDILRSRLLEFFDADQIDLIESAYEAYVHWGQLHLEAPQPATFSQAQSFGRQFKDSRARMIAIMQNIIDNDGTFVVP